MKNLLLAAAAAITALALPSPACASNVDVGVSVQISQPGVYGRIDIGRFPQPQVVLPQPVIIAAPPPPRVGVVQAPAPVYMWVPPGHRKKWDKHCRDYNACGVPVYFVSDDWYERNVRSQAGKGGKGANGGQGKGHGPK